MAHFAKINENNYVVNVIVVPDEQEHRGEEYLNEIGLEGRWIQTSYNNNIRGRFAGTGMFYNEETDMFEPAKPYPSWIWDETYDSWVSPVPEPDYDSLTQKAVWNEENGVFDIVDIESPI